MLLLLDGSNLIHRVLRTDQLKLTNSYGLNTGGIHGFIRSIYKLCRESRFSYFPICCWDEGIIKFRRSIYEGYKDHKKVENRDQVPTKEEQDEKDFLQSLFWTKNILHTSILPLLGIPSIMVPGVEADDIIAFLSTRINDLSLIVSNDADLFQLINDKVKVYKPVKDVTYDKDKLIDEYALDRSEYKKHFVLIKAIVGGEDGIPHVVKGIGPKHATKIARKLITGEALDVNNPKEFSVLQSLVEINRNVKLMDLSYFQDHAKEEVDLIRISFCNNLINREYDEFSVYRKFSELELNEVSELVPDLLDTGYSTRERLVSLVMNNNV